MFKSIFLVIELFTYTSAFSQTKEMSFAFETHPRTIDPRFANDANSQYLSDLTNCSLISYNSLGNIEGQIASTWKWTGPTTLQLEIKPNIKFSDGSLLNIEDIVSTYSFLTSKNSSSPIAGSFRKVKSIKAVSEKLIQFELTEADSTFVDNLFIGILPKRLSNLPMISDPSQLIGCGAFKITKIDSSDYTLTRNDHYSLGPIAKLNAVHLKVIKDDTTRFSKLRKGELDLVQNGISRGQLKSIPHSYPNLKVDAKAGLNVMYLGFNFKDPILSKKEVRQALSLGVNRDEIVQYILQGLAEKAKGFLSKENPYCAENLPNIEFNKEQAKILLDKAGFPEKGPDKVRFEIILKTTSEMTRVNIAYGIAGHLKELGIKVRVQALEWGKFKYDLDKGNVQLWIANWIGYKDPDIYRYTLASESFPPHGGNRGWYSNIKLDKILDEAHKSHDEKVRKNLYVEAQKIVSEDLPYVFLWHDKNYVVYNKNLKDYELYADGRYSSLRNVMK